MKVQKQWDPPADYRTDGMIESMNTDRKSAGKSAKNRRSRWKESSENKEKLALPSFFIDNFTAI